MHKKFELNRTKIKGFISCQSEGGQVSLVFSVLYKYIRYAKYKDFISQQNKLLVNPCKTAQPVLLVHHKG